MKDGVPGAPAEGGVNCSRIGEIGFDQTDTGGNGLPMTLAEIVEHRDFGAAIAEMQYEVAADVASATSH